MNEADERELLSGIRWTSNIVVELLSNHGDRVGIETRNGLRKAIDGLYEAEIGLKGLSK